MKTKMTKDIIAEGFTLGLALVDALPVIFFAGSMFLIGQRFSSNLFMIGTLLCVIGGAGIVLMTVFAMFLDSSDVRANWIEQLTNGLAQGAFFLGILLMG